MALDAMAYLACVDRRYPDAARIAGVSDRAHEAHGQAERRPTERRLRQLVADLLEPQLGAAWPLAAADRPIDEAGACALALGLTA
jgi:hypothetical protein